MTTYTYSVATWTPNYPYPVPTGYANYSAVIKQGDDINLTVDGSVNDPPATNTRYYHGEYALDTQGKWSSPSFRLAYNGTELTSTTNTGILSPTFTADTAGISGTTAVVSRFRFFTRPYSRNNRLSFRALVLPSGFTSPVQNVLQGGSLNAQFKPPNNSANNLFLNGLKFYWKICNSGTTTQASGFTPAAGWVALGSTTSGVAINSTVGASTATGAYTLRVFHINTTSDGTGVAASTNQVCSKNFNVIASTVSVDSSITLGGLTNDGTNLLMLRPNTPGTTQSAVTMTGGGSADYYWIFKNTDSVNTSSNLSTQSPVGRTWSTSTGTQTFYNTSGDGNSITDLPSAGATRTYKVFASDATGLNGVDTGERYTVGVVDTNIQVTLNPSNTVLDDSVNQVKATFTGTGLVGNEYRIKWTEGGVTNYKNEFNHTEITLSNNDLPSGGNARTYVIEGSLGTSAFDFRNFLTLDTNRTFSLSRSLDLIPTLTGSFVNTTNAAFSTIYTANPGVRVSNVQISYNHPFTIDGADSTVQYSLDNGNTWTNYNSGAKTIQNNQTIKLRLTTGTTASEAKTLTFYLTAAPSVTRSWTVTTAPLSVVFTTNTVNVDEGSSFELKVVASNLPTNQAISCTLSGGASPADFSTRRGRN